MDSIQQTNFKQSWATYIDKDIYLKTARSLQEILSEKNVLSIF